MIDKIAFAIFNFFDKINEKLEDLLTFQFPEVKRKKNCKYCKCKCNGKCK